MGQFRDLSGQQFGTLIADEYVGHSKWKCHCIECGNVVYMTASWLNKNIRLGRDGCKHAKPIHIGDTFGYLTVIEQADDYIKPKSGAHEKQYKCRCICGREKVILESNLKSYKSTTCGLCSNRISIPEKMIFYYLSLVFDDVQENYRPDFLNGKEIDIYISSLNVGIEYDGERWHKDIDLDLNKSRLCSLHGIHLIHVREPQCNKSDEFEYQIITPKPITNGTHMTNPIRQIFDILKSDFGVEYNISVDCLRDNADICKNIILSSGFNSLAYRYPEIAKEWDYTKNYPRTPDNVSAHSGNKAWWICNICGCSYSSVIASRTGKDKCGCPDCRYKKLYKKVLCVETGRVFDSVKEAADFVKKKPCSITSCCRGYNHTNTVGGYHWKYVDDNKERNNYENISE